MPKFFVNTNYHVVEAHGLLHAFTTRYCTMVKNLRIAYRRLNSQRPFLGDVPRVGHFFKLPTCLSRSMGEVIS